ncbi:MAG: bifunctional riboflavin kinase/FAD synthetase [Anaerolineaceae bacterium]
MTHITDLEDFYIDNSWITIGSFDGVHRGHQSLVRSMVGAAHRERTAAGVVTFFPHPAFVLRKMSNPFYLTSPDERAALLNDLGVDFVITIPFDEEMAARTARDFIQLIKSHLGFTRLWAGSDFALGRGRQGNLTYLEELGTDLDFEVDEIPAVSSDGLTISSSQIRSLISRGALHQAAAQLGRWYSLDGRIITGDGRGRTLGIPTANLEIWHQRLVPASGVYATRAWVDEKSYLSVTNIGFRPTFENENTVSRVESHLLDFDQDLYNKNVRLDFIELLRPEHRFKSKQHLLFQIQEDISQAREVLSHATRSPGVPA